jgi:hypothetical protein
MSAVDYGCGLGVMVGTGTAGVSTSTCAIQPSSVPIVEVSAVSSPNRTRYQSLLAPRMINSSPWMTEPTIVLSKLGAKRTFAADVVTVVTMGPVVGVGVAGAVVGVGGAVVGVFVAATVAVAGAVGVAGAAGSVRSTLASGALVVSVMALAANVVAVLATGIESRGVGTTTATIMRMAISAVSPTSTRKALDSCENLKNKSQARPIPTSSNTMNMVVLM